MPKIVRDRALSVSQPSLMSHDIYSRGRFGADHLDNGVPETTWALLPGEDARATIS
jgi:hypothetical protein